MRRFLDIIGSCLLIIIAVFAIYLCVYLGFELSSSVNGENIQQEQPEEPHEHIFGEWQVVTVATCTEEGKEQRLCECGETETRTIAATGHNYTETIVAPTCTEQGYTLHTCTNCEHTYTDNEIAALGHEFGEWQVITAATCTEVGLEQRTCECGETETRTIAATGHNYTETIVAPTCTEQGYTLHTCTNCEHTYTDNEIAALGHEFGEWEIDVDPTYTQEGSKHRTCTRCDAEETEAILKLDVVIEIEENLLLIPEINPSKGTINLYYAEVGSDVTSSYVIGNVTSFDLTTLLTIDYMPMEAGKTYELKIMYDSGAGDYIYSNVITYESPVNYEYAGYWLYDIEGAGTWVIRMTETTFELAEAIKVDGKYETTTDYELFNLNANTLEGNHLNLYVNPDDTSEVYLYYDTTTNLLVYGGMAASRINEEDVSSLPHTSFISNADYLNNTFVCSSCNSTCHFASCEESTEKLVFTGYTSSGSKAIFASQAAYYVVSGFNSNLEYVYIPATYKDKPVRLRGDQVLTKVNVKYVYVENGVQIDSSSSLAFKNCSYLNYISLPSSAQGITFDFTGCPSDLVVYYHS